MRALVLDFDGVISDSALESFEVAFRTYLILSPNSSLAHRDRNRLYPMFLELMPLGNRAEDFGVVLAALENEAPIASQEGYDAFRGQRGAPWLERFHRVFYETRQALREEDLEAWHSWMAPYAEFVELLRRWAPRVPLAIATAKDRTSVEDLLCTYAIDDLFSSEWIFDKETGMSKTAHLRALQAQMKIPFEEMTFIDDKVNHLDAVSTLNVRCALAGWGYNGDRERELALARGHLVLEFDDAEKKLFGT